MLRTVGIYTLAAGVLGAGLAACGDDATDDATDDGHGDGGADAGSATRLNIVLSNDDGWDTPGIQQMKLALRAAGHRVILVAPGGSQSGVGAALSFGEAEPMEQGVDEYALDASPGTCVHAAVALYGAQGETVDLVVAGTNDQTNIGSSTVTSGTLGVLVAGLSLGIPGVASSSFAENAMTEPEAYQAHYARVAAVMAALVERLTDGADLVADFPVDLALSLNYPPLAPEDVAGLRVAPQGINSIFHAADGVTGVLSVERPVVEGSDFDYYGMNNVTVTPLTPDYGAELDADTQAMLSAASLQVPPARSLEVLLTSEQTWDSEGLIAMADALMGAGHVVTISAPDVESRGGANQAGFSSPCQRELRADGDDSGTGDLDAGVLDGLDGGAPVEVKGHGIYSTNAPPSLCLSTAISAMTPKPDLILSGVQTRVHAGAQLVHSGALGPVTTGLASGYPALSVGTDGGSGAALQAVAADVAALVSAMTHGPDGLLPQDLGLMINFGQGASLQDVVFTQQGKGSDFSYVFVGDGELMSADGPPIEAADAQDADTVAIADGKLSILGIRRDWTARQEVFPYVEALTEGLLDAAAP